MSILQNWYKFFGEKHILALLPILWQESQTKLIRNNTKKAKNDLLPRYG